LLSAILRQNPRFHAEATSPLLMLFNTVLETMTPRNEFSSFFDDRRKRAILTGLLDSYYGAIPPEDTVFDTNRAWTSRTPLLFDLYPDARIICCVRNVGWIIDSLEVMLQKNPLELSRVFSFKVGGSIYSRVETLMNSENGLIGFAWSALREAWFGPHAKQMIILPYEKLASKPRDTISALYGILGEEFFQHDFEHLGMPGLHTVRAAVNLDARRPCIPPDLFAKHADLSFWEKSKLNYGGAIVI
jgi:sulfotransferase